MKPLTPASVLRNTADDIDTLAPDLQNERSYTDGFRTAVVATSAQWADRPSLLASAPWTLARWCAFAVLARRPARGRIQHGHL